MLKVIRESAIEHPWRYRLLMGLIAVAFVVTMGWGIEESLTQKGDDYIVSVGNDHVSRDEYQRAYQNTYRYYKEIIPGDIPEDRLKQLVIDQLIESRLWIQAAKDLGVVVTPNELRDAIMKIPAFQRNGTFDPEQYKRVLTANRLTLESFETAHKADLMREKARALVRDSVVPTADELAEAQAVVASQPSPKMPMTGQAASPLERATQAVLAQKQERALRAFQEALKTKAKVSVRRELM
jgi:peptidyl-prolyl cis-trans isomerase D